MPDGEGLDGATPRRSLSLWAWLHSSHWIPLGWFVELLQDACAGLVAMGQVQRTFAASQATCSGLALRSRSHSLISRV